MFSLWVNGEFLQLKHQSLSVVLSSPIFRGQDTMNYSLPFEVPNTPVNQKILSYPGAYFYYKLPEDNRFDFRLYYSGALLFTGILKVIGTSFSSLELVLIISNTSLLNQVREKYLSEIDLGGDRDMGAWYVTLLETIEKSFPQVDFNAFPVEDEKFFDGTEFQTYYREHFNCVNFFTTAYGFYHLNSPIVPFPYLGYVYCQIFKSHGFEFIDNVFLKDTDLSRLVIFNTHCINSSFDNSQLLLDPPSVFNLCNNVPHIKVSDFLNEMANLGIIFFIDPQTSKVTTRTIDQVFKDSTCLDFNLMIASESISLEFETKKGFAFSFSGDGSDEYTSGKVQDISSFHYRGTVQSYEDLPMDENQVNDCFFCYEDNTFYVWSFRENFNENRWWNCGSGLSPHYQGNREFAIEAANGSLAMEWGSTSPDRIATWIVPKTEQAGNCRSYPDFQSNAFSLRLLLYHGMKKDNWMDDYPFGSSSNFDYYGNQCGNLSISWHGQWGFYERYWKEFLFWYLGGVRIFKFKAYGHIGDIKSLDLSRKYRYNNLIFFIKTVKINFDESSQVSFEFETLLL